VWIDTAYHQSVIDDPDYAIALKVLMHLYPANICFGSDWPLVLMDVPSYHAYVQAFIDILTPEQWALISYTNPMRMLGKE
jgi:predicted TIM-barrel fold metal-dependent hydrolase